MKKRLQSLERFAFSLLLIVHKLSAAAIGNPAAPSMIDEGLKIPDTCWWNVRIGINEELLIEQKYRERSEKKQVAHASVKGQTQAICATWNVLERLDIQTQLGWGELRWRWHRAGIAEDGDAIHGLYWNASAKLILFQVKQSVLSAAIRGGGWHDFSSSFYVEGENSQATTLSSLFWQTSIAFSQQIGFLSPYIGIALQQDSLQIQSIHLINRYRKGPFGGLTFSNGSYLFFNVEGCGWIETSCSFSCEIRI